MTAWPHTIRRKIWLIVLLLGGSGALLGASGVFEFLGAFAGLVLFYAAPIIGYDYYNRTKTTDDREDKTDKLTVETDPYLQEEIKTNVDES